MCVHMLKKHSEIHEIVDPENIHNSDLANNKKVNGSVIYSQTDQISQGEVIVIRDDSIHVCTDTLNVYLLSDIRWGLP